MLNLTRVIDRATGYVYLPPQSGTGPPGTVPPKTDAAKSSLPNTYALFTSAAGPMRAPRSDVRDVQERWIDARDAWDDHERGQWKHEGEIVRDAKEQVAKAQLQAQGLA
jgi:hypothetical protein